MIIRQRMIGVVLMLAVSQPSFGEGPPEFDQPKQSEGVHNFDWTGSFPTQELNLTVDATGKVASVKYIVKRIAANATEDNPGCSEGRLRMFGFTIWGSSSDANCVRVCGAVPAGYEINHGLPITGKTNHAYSNTFGAQFFLDTNKACLTIKNWSAHIDAEGQMLVPVCKAGEGCKNIPPVTVIEPPQKKTTSERDQKLPTPRSDGLSK